MPKINLPRYQGPHKSGQAYCRWQKKTIYLGKYGSDESVDEFKKLVAAIVGGDPEPIKPRFPTPEHPVVDLAEPYLDFAESYYSQNEYDCIRYAVDLLLELHGSTELDQFGPLALKQVREAMIAKDWSRPYTNHQIARLKRMWRFGVENEIVPASLAHAIESVKALRKGRTEARETEPVEPVADEIVAATLPFMSATIAMMVRTQRIAGMRPGEVCSMQMRDLEGRGDTWLYRPGQHKNTWRRKPRVIAIPASLHGPLWEYLKPEPEDYVFTPKPRGCVKRPCYTEDTYRVAVARAAKKAIEAGAKAVHWSPGQLRHSAADEAVRILGPVAAQRLLGHANLDTTSIYLSQMVDDLVHVTEQLDARRRSE
jgi:integrase